MRILMVTSKRYLPQFYGGAEVSIHSMCHVLKQMGHEVAVLAELMPGNALAWQNRLKHLLGGRRKNFPADHALGYPVFRGWKPTDAVSEVKARWKPDVVFAQSGRVIAMAEAFEAQQLPVCVFLRHAHYDHLGGLPRTKAGRVFIANSQDTARRYAADFGLQCYVHSPTIVANLCKTETDRSRVVFVNPIPEKGVDVVLQLANTRPDIGFDIVESWAVPEWKVAPAKQLAASLPNVRWLKPRLDMRSIYQHARLVIMPSGVGCDSWTEAWGRVASEAQVSGIPVLASNSGGLPEAVGEGGVVVSCDAPFADWQNAFGRLVDDADFYQQCSEAARKHAAREAISPVPQMQQILDLLQSTHHGR